MHEETYYPYDYYALVVNRWYTTFKVIDHVVSARECQAECFNNDLCLFFSYVEVNVGETNGLAPGVCLLKMPRATPQIGITSGTRYGIGRTQLSIKIFIEKQPCLFYKLSVENNL